MGFGNCEWVMNFWNWSMEIDDGHEFLEIVTGNEFLGIVMEIDEFWNGN